MFIRLQRIVLRQATLSIISNDGESRTQVTS